MHHLLLTLLPLLLLPPPLAASTPALTDRYTPHRRLRGGPQEYLDPTVPPPPATSAAAFSLSILTVDFADTYGSPPSAAPYNPPSLPWSRAVLDLSFSAAGEQYDRVAAVWLAGAELLRTSTAEPSPDPGVLWHVRKDVTRYSALLRSPSNLSVMLENIVDHVLTGVYHLNVSIDFFLAHHPDPKLRSGFDQPGRRMMIQGEKLGLSSVKLGALGRELVGNGESGEKLVLSLVEAGDRSSRKIELGALEEDPADLILPISRESPESGYWFRFENASDAIVKSGVVVPPNAYRAVLEIYVSAHGNDEFWYANPPDSYIEMNNLTTGRGNGAFREVFATIDGRFVGAVLPFPVIFTGGINPLFWAPVVAIGAFDLPSYNLELTPFLGLLVDGKPHDFGLGITDGIAFWLVDANLHLWLDPHSDSINAELVQYKAPAVSVSRTNISSQLNGAFNIEAERKIHFSGWVNSSLGNMTTEVEQKVKFKSNIEFLNDGNYKEVHMKAKSKTDIRIREGPKVVVAHRSHKVKYPLTIVTSALPGENNTYTSSTNLSHTLYEENSHVLGKAVTTCAIVDRQVAVGEMLVQDHSVLAGSASSEQTYQYRDDNGCYLRTVSAKDGNLLSDNLTNVCASAS